MTAISQLIYIVVVNKVTQIRLNNLKLEIKWNKHRENKL